MQPPRNLFPRRSRNVEPQAAGSATRELFSRGNDGTKANDQQNRSDNLDREYGQEYEKEDPQPSASASLLCDACSKIRFLQSEPKYTATGKDELWEGVTLEHVLQNRTVCGFCEVLFRSLCQESNDPLRHKIIEENLQTDLKGKTFQQWSEDINTKSRLSISKSFLDEKRWPFGRSICCHVTFLSRQGLLGTDFRQTRPYIR